MDILSRIKELREIRGMSVYELSKKSGVSMNTIYKWYNKNYSPSLETLKAICEKGFNIKLIEFLAVDSNLIPASDETKEIFDIWNSLNEEQKQLIKNIMISYTKK